LAKEITKTVVRGRRRGKEEEEEKELNNEELEDDEVICRAPKAYILNQFAIGQARI
jgi:hypothetical protein